MSQTPSLVKLWDYEGQAATSGVQQHNKVKVVPGNSVIKTEFIKYYQKPEAEKGSGEATIVHANGDAAAVAKKPNQPSQRKTIIAVPVVSKTPGVTMSPFKMEQAILPKTVHLSSSPVILSSPQRIVANVISSPRNSQQAMSSPGDPSSWAGKRPSSSDCDYSDNKKCKKGEKGGKGLRHFSMKVCEKVRKKGTTSYNEVADELVAEFTDPHHNFNLTEQAYDQKNIRRRVYDALNVLMAMNIISKEKKEIKWLGLPTNSAQEYQNLEKEKNKRLERIKVKMQHLQELIHQQVAFKNLVERNKVLDKHTAISLNGSRIHLPFIIVNTDKKTLIDCSISPDKTEYVFHFNDTFQVHDDIEILKRMGMVLNLDKGSCTPEELERAKQLVPKALQPYVIQMAQGVCEYPPGMSSAGNGVKIESNLMDDPTSDFQEASSSSALGSEYVGLEVALESSQTGLSRQSSVGSLSDMPSRPEVSTPEDYSEHSESESSGEDV